MTFEKLPQHFKGRRSLVYIELWRHPQTLTYRQVDITKWIFCVSDFESHKVSIITRKQFLYYQIITVCQYQYALCFVVLMQTAKVFKAYDPQTEHYFIHVEILIFKLLEFSRNQQKTLKTWHIYIWNCIS